MSTVRYLRNIPLLKLFILIMEPPLVVSNLERFAIEICLAGDASVRAKNVLERRDGF
jgi:hypothetical protein